MGENNSVEISASISWTLTLEEYFASTGEKAAGLAWVHKRSEAMYSNRKTYIDLPVIIGSGLIAFLNAGSQSLFEDPKISSVALGVGSLMMGILNSVGTYFGWSKRAEGHRLSAIHYSRLCRFITVELSLPRQERMSPHDFLKYVKDQYDRLAEISPMVPEIIIQQFQSKFKHENEISKPEEANGIHKISVYRDLEYDADSLKDVPTTNAGFSPIQKSNSFVDVSSPGELPKMTIRIPEPVKKPEPVKEEEKAVTQSEVIVEIPKSISPHED